MVYSAKDNDGFLTKAGIEAMRSELATISSVRTLPRSRKDKIWHGAV